MVAQTMEEKIQNIGERKTNRKPPDMATYMKTIQHK